MPAARSPRAPDAYRHTARQACRPFRARPRETPRLSGTWSSWSSWSEVPRRREPARSVCGRGGARIELHIDVVEPGPGIGGGTREQPEECPLQLLGDRAAATRADCNAIDRADRRDLGGRAGEEQLIGQVEHLAWNGGLAHFQALQACEFHDGIPGQTTENRMCQVGREQHAVLDDEDVLAGTLAHGAIGRKSNALGESKALGLLADELAREVIAAGFGERRQGVGSNPLPGGDADVDAGFLALMAQVFAPFPGCHRHVHRRIDLRRHANFDPPVDVAIAAWEWGKY